MSKDDFVWIMRCLYRTYYDLRLEDGKSIKIVNDLLNTCISILSNFDKAVADSLNIYILTHPEFSEKEIEGLYNFYVSPDGLAN